MQIKEYKLALKLSQLEPLPTPEEIEPANDKSEYKESVLAISDDVLRATWALVGYGWNTTLHRLDNNQSKTLNQRGEGKNRRLPQDTFHIV